MDFVKAVEIRDLCYSYPDGTLACENVSFDVNEGETLGLVGANGAGKSTILLHLNGILRGDGEIRIFGVKLDDSTLREIRQVVGLVFQNPDDQLFTNTIYEDVAFGPRNMGLSEDEVAHRVGKSLDSVGLGGKNGNETRFYNRSAFHLSFGEKKRASIATVLAMEPKILVLDEPSSNLDPAGRREIMALLKNLGGTQIIVTHNLEFVRNLCDRVVVMGAGKVAAIGCPEE